MSGKILVIGSSCVDVILQLDHLPVTEEDMHPRSQRFRMGGCAYNTANILGKAGADVRFVTPVGLRGLFGPYVLREVEKQPWVRPVCLADEENGCCYCLVEKGGERTFLSVHGAEYTFRPEWMTEERQIKYDYVFVSGLEVEERTGEALTAFLEGMGSGTVFYAPGPRAAVIPERRQGRIMDLHPILHLNREETMRLSGRASAREAAAALRDRTGNTVFVTCGSEGALCADREGSFFWEPARKGVRVRDTIGAGDAHAGTVLYGLAEGMDPKRILALANRMSALVVGVEGSSLEKEAILNVLYPKEGDR